MILIEHKDTKTQRDKAAKKRAKRWNLHVAKIGFQGFTDVL